MAGARVQWRRRGRGAAQSGLLVEREEELAVLRRRLAAARRGKGGVVVIEAAAGSGKSRLLKIAGDLARRGNMQVLGAQGSELERDFAFGVALQLLEPRWLSLDERERSSLAAGPAHSAGQLLTGTLPEADELPRDRTHALIRGLFWLVRNLLDAPAGDGGASLTMLVDDVHLADSPSVRFLAYLADRIAELPIALIVAAGEGESSADPPALGAIRAAAGDAVLRPGSLSLGGVEALVRSEFPDADPTFGEVCAQITSGNPFLLAALLDHIRQSEKSPDETTAAGLEELAPDSVLDAVVARLTALPAEMSSLVSAVAVLGGASSLRRAALLADLDLDTASHAADALASLHLFSPGAPLAFVHPLVCSAVKASMSPLARGGWHRRAATILIDEGAPEEQIAVHLLAASPSSDPGSVQVLRAAAWKALARGAADIAVRMLERALEEEPPPELYGEVLAELGQAEVAAGLPSAVQRLEQALSLTEERPRRIQLALTQSQALRAHGRYAEAAEVLAVALDEVDEDESAALVDDLEAAYIATAALVPALSTEARRRGQEMLARIEDQPTTGQRTALAHLAWLSSLLGEPRASVVSSAALAWGEGSLLAAGPAERPVWPLLIEALLFVDELELALQICDEAVDVAGEHQPSPDVVADYCRVWPLYLQGRVTDAMAVAERVVATPDERWHEHAYTLYGAMAACQIQQGALAEAEAALSILDQPGSSSIRGAFLLEKRAQLRLAQRRPEEALVDAMQAGERCNFHSGEAAPGAVPWRSTAALAHLALGDPSSAERLAGEELERSRASGTTRLIIRDLRVLGLAGSDRRRFAPLEQAVSEGERYSTRLEYIHALIDLGAAMRRANQRAAAREPLRRGLELSQRAGAMALADLARSELAATGSRSRREMFTGIEALTPSERRVADLAAEGLTTRQIADNLFVTPKTVEFHLRHIYGKLGVSSRAELALNLRGQGSEPQP